jgi:hypothetical protein
MFVKTTALLLAIFVSLSIIRPASAGRPLIVDDVAPIPPGHLEIEVGFSHALPRTGGRDQQWPVATASFGVVDGLEVGLAIQRTNQDEQRTAPTKGFEDLHLTAKYQFLDDAGFVPALAVSLDVKLPTANRSKGLSTGKTDETLLLIATKSLAPFTVHANFGYTIVGKIKGADLKNQLQGGIAGELPLIPSWTLVGEVTGLSRSTGAEPNQVNFQLGLRYAIQPTLVLDLAAGRSLLPSGPTFKGAFGVTWTIDFGKLITR